MDEQIFILDDGKPNLEDYRDMIRYDIKMPLELALRNLENGVQKTTEDAERAMATFTSTMKLWDILEAKVAKEIEKARKARKGSPENPDDEEGAMVRDAIKRRQRMTGGDLVPSGSGEAA